MPNSQSSRLDLRKETLGLTALIMLIRPPVTVEPDRAGSSVNFAA